MKTKIYLNKTNFEITLIKLHELNQVEQILLIDELHNYENISIDEFYSIKLSMDLY